MPIPAVHRLCATADAVPEYQPRCHMVRPPRVWSGSSVLGEGEGEGAPLRRAFGARLPALPTAPSAELEGRAAPPLRANVLHVHAG